MSNRTDSAIAAAVIRVEGNAAALIDVLERELPLVQDDSAYWSILLAAWMKNGRAEYQDRYRALMLSRRRNRRRAMKHASRAVYDRLPTRVRVWRAVAPGEDPDRSLSWTLDPARIRELYPDRPIVERVVPRRCIAFYTDRRGEREVVIPVMPAATTSLTENES